MDKPLQPGKFKGKGRGSVSGEMASLELKEAYNKTQFKKKETAIISNAIVKGILKTGKQIPNWRIPCHGKVDRSSQEGVPACL